MGDTLGSAIEFGSNLFSSVGSAAPGVAETASAVGPSTLGTAEAFLNPASASALTAVGPTALGTATDFLAAPLATGVGDALPAFGPTADLALGNASSTGLATGVPGTGNFLPGSLTPSAPFSATGVASTAPFSSPMNANAQASVFDTGTSPVTGVSSTGAPSAVTGTPGSASATPTASPSVGNLAPTANVAPADATGTGSIWDKLLGSATKSVTSNPLGIALGSAALGYDVLKGQQASSAQKQMQNLAQQNLSANQALVNQGEALVQPLATGNLPPQYQAQITQAVNDAITAAKSRAAANGQSADPAQNSVLAQQIAEINNQIPQMTAQVAEQLAQTGQSLISSGQSATGMSSSLYSQLANMDQRQSEATANAIGKLAQAFNTGSTGKSATTLPGTNITISNAA